MLKTYILFHKGWIPLGTPVENTFHCTMDKFTKDKDNTDHKIGSV